MRPTAFIYSSHDRCDYIHREFIVERALESRDNKTLLHLPMSQRNRGGQEYDFGSFKWYYEKFRQYGLEYFPFFWNDNLRKEDADVFFNMLENSQVVVLGGGNSSIGLARYKALGEIYYNDRDLFRRILHRRQARGLLTVGFSAGADQLCEYLSGCIYYNMQDPYGFGLAKNILTTVHHESKRDRRIYRLAAGFTYCMAFGLPNDSGIGIDQGYLPSGNIWQIIWFVTDNSWDKPKDRWHIKTRSGAKIQHYYFVRKRLFKNRTAVSYKNTANRRYWGFNGGDMMVRVMSPDNVWQNALIITNQGQFIDYWTQSWSHYSGIEEFLADH